MEKTVEKKEGDRVEVELRMEWDEMAPFYEKALLGLGKDIVVPGFRAGRAPREMLEKKIPDFRILEEAANSALNANYGEILRENNLRAIGSPKIEILKLAKDNPFECKIIIEILPEIILPDYKKIAKEVEKPKIVLDEKEIEKSLDWIRKQQAQFLDLTSLAKKGDFVHIIYQSPQIQDNKEFQDSFLLGEGGFPPGFEENLEGIKPGEVKNFFLELPEDSRGRPRADLGQTLAGQKVEFKVKMEKVQKIILPDLNDEFAKKLKFENLEKLKEQIKQDLEQGHKNEENQKWREEILEKISAQTNFEAPNFLVLQEQARMMHELEHNVEESLKISLADYLAKINKSKKEVEKNLQEQAQKSLKNSFILSEIAQKEDIQIKDTEIAEVIQQVLTSYPQEERSKIDLNRLKEYYREKMTHEKVFQFLCQ